jgi:hypothetical protein
LFYHWGSGCGIPPSLTTPCYLFRLTANGWYPHVVGPDKSGRETDKLAGKNRRLFVHGQSKWEVEFRKVGEK